MLIKEALTYDDILLSPQRSKIKTRKDTDTKTKLTKNISINIPIVSANMDSVTESSMAIHMALEGGVGAIHRVMSIEKQIEEISKVKNYEFDKNNYELANTDKEGKLLVGASLGIRMNPKENLKQLIKAGADFIIIDVAHAHSESVIELVKEIKKEYREDIELIIGNIATAEAARDFLELDVSGVKVGIGPGSICTTRIVTGVGVPQVTAIDDVYSILKESSIPIIADGGIRNSGDIVKALALGASSVMIGNLFARCEEAPGEIVIKDGKRYKNYRGEASFSEIKKRFEIDKRNDIKNITPEGIEGIVQVVSNVEDTIRNLVGGIRSGLSYCNAYNLEELRKNAKFLKITNAGLIESNYHDIIKL